MKLNKIEKQYLDKAIIRGGLFLLDADSAIKFIGACQVHNIVILGVDAFLLFDNKTQPVMDYSIDFTSNNYSNSAFNRYNDSIILIEKRKDLYFEIITK
ncbi:MAG: hypothetical protein EKK37_14860 [Sphingobacteriales bacterium]|nr:MAG: hypothetical protein EKK37_14860 [Sphingobacteriales bacterium]